MIPETFKFIEDISRQAADLGIEVLVEIHSHYLRQVEIARQVDRVYDFALPPLALHAIFNHTSRYLKQWLEISPRNAVTVLDTHDGIGVIDIGASSTAGADRSDAESRPGILPMEELDALVEKIHANSHGQSRMATGAAASNLDLYQVNCTYYDALGRSDSDYLLARAIQFFAPGIPQVYYVGLLAGENDMDLLAKSGVGRDINRHYYTLEEIDRAVQRPVVRALFELIRFRNQHPAFQGSFRMPEAPDSTIILRWDNGDDWAMLVVDFVSGSYTISNSPFKPRTELAPGTGSRR